MYIHITFMQHGWSSIVLNLGTKVSKYMKLVNYLCHGWENSINEQNMNFYFCLCFSKYEI